MGKIKSKGKSGIDGPFVAVPHYVIDSQAFADLSGSAVRLLIHLARQYRGRNNGDLSASFEQMRDRGWRSKETLFAARQELIAAGFIAETRKGARPNKATLYGLTWRPLDDCGGKLEVTPAGFPVRAFLTAESPRLTRPTAGASRAGGVNDKGKNRPPENEPRAGPIAPKTVPQAKADVRKSDLSEQFHGLPRYENRTPI